MGGIHKKRSIQPEGVIPFPGGDGQVPAVAVAG